MLPEPNPNYDYDIVAAETSEDDLRGIRHALISAAKSQVRIAAALERLADTTEEKNS